MWDTAEGTTSTITRDMPCSQCGHAMHNYLACSDECRCVPSWVSGVIRERRLMGSATVGVSAPKAA